jgi:DNA-binding NarL/FixJ family response regulator
MRQKNSALSLINPARRSRVIVADPFPVIVCGVRKMMEDDPRFQVVAEASTMSSFRKKVMAERPDVALLDWHMASQDLEVTIALIKSDLHAASIIFLTVSENSPEKREMLRLGARAFVSKWCSAGKLRTAVSKACPGPVSPGSSVAGASVSGRLSAASPTDAARRIEELTHRERQLLPLVCSGRKNKEIALHLGIAESTVWHHLTSIFTKLQVGDRLGLVTFAYGHGLVQPEADTGRAEYGSSATSLRVVEPLELPSPKYPPMTDFDRQLSERAQP